MLGRRFQVQGCLRDSHKPSPEIATNPTRFMAFSDAEIPRDSYRKSTTSPYDQVSDAVLDACLAVDSKCRVACEKPQAESENRPKSLNVYSMFRMQKSLGIHSVHRRRLRNPLVGEADSQHPKIASRFSCPMNLLGGRELRMLLKSRS